jgi:hypothetical protein
MESFIGRISNERTGYQCSTWDVALSLQPKILLEKGFRVVAANIFLESLRLPRRLEDGGAGKAGTISIRI